jgi:hypothetical protein
LELVRAESIKNPFWPAPHPDLAGKPGHRPVTHEIRNTT